MGSGGQILIHNFGILSNGLFLEDDICCRFNKNDVFFEIEVVVEIGVIGFIVIRVIIIEDIFYIFMDFSINKVDVE
jgi:hypothetical protein